MFYLIYVSSAVNLMEGKALQNLLEQSRENNQRLEITGLLLYKGGNFMQMLEGDQQTVLALYERIKQDERHKGVIRIMMGLQSNRIFDQWSMGFKEMDEWGASQTFDEFQAKKLVNRSDLNEEAQDAYKFMLQFQKKVD
ncbi:MAG: BLUF domain-containing protein [Planctomycetota bacterium]